MQLIETIKRHQFLFEELSSRDFKQKYKRTLLGMGWSLMYPLLTLIIQRLIFARFFGNSTPHYTIYLFAGNIVWNYFREATQGGMRALWDNAHIFTKVNVPKYIFVLTKNVSALINFSITIALFFLFVWLDRIAFSWRFFSLLIPSFCMVLFNLGIGMMLSAMFVFFRDTGYLYEVFLTLLMYMSAIFYSVDSFPDVIQKVFLLNPVYCYIKYFRAVVIDGNLPSLSFNLICVFYALLALFLGSWIYKKKNHEFLYYV
ncbi:MAG: ABC transporter permease [Clostridia bacterium]|nr:ABC transporter permease [Clostridia bacterium]